MLLGLDDFMTTWVVSCGVCPDRVLKGSVGVHNPVSLQLGVWEWFLQGDPEVTDSIKTGS